jgi:hypothetical protein
MTVSKTISDKVMTKANPEERTGTGGRAIEGFLMGVQGLKMGSEADAERLKLLRHGSCGEESLDDPLASCEARIECIYTVKLPSGSQRKPKVRYV